MTHETSHPIPLLHIQSAVHRFKIFCRGLWSADGGRFHGEGEIGGRGIVAALCRVRKRSDSSEPKIKPHPLSFPLSTGVERGIGGEVL